MKPIFFKEGKSNFSDKTCTEITEIIFPTSCQKFKIFLFILFEKKTIDPRRTPAQGCRLSSTLIKTMRLISNLPTYTLLYQSMPIYICLTVNNKQPINLSLSLSLSLSLVLFVTRMIIFYGIAVESCH